MQHQIGDNMGLSATYLGNRMMNVWGDVTGNPGCASRGGVATGPCTLKTTTGTQTFANCSTAPLDLRRELSQVRSGGRALSSGISTRSPIRAGSSTTGCCCRSSAVPRTGSRRRQLHVVEVRGPDQTQGGNPLNVGTGYMRAGLAHQSAGRRRRPALDVDKGPCDNSRNHIFNLTASVETPQFEQTAARMLASGWRLSGIFRATSGTVLTITTGIDRALNGWHRHAAREPGARRSVRRQDAEQLVQSGGVRAAGARDLRETSGRNAYEGPGSRTLDLSLVRSFGLPNSHRIEARIEAFNAFNWFRWGNPITTFSNANFGRILTAGDPRIMQFAVKYQF